VRSAPLAVAEEELAQGALRIAAGAWHTCAGTDGRVYCWGQNRFGQLAAAGRTPRYAPAVSGFPDCTAAECTYELAGGNTHTCALVGPPDPVSEPTPDGDGGAPAEVEDLVLSVACAGDNSFGQLGDGTTSARATVRHAADGPHDAVAIAMGFGHGCYIDDPGQVWCWGLNSQGQLGTGDRDASEFPVAVEGVDDAIAIAAGSTHTCAVHGAGRVSCWGGNGRGQLGSESPDDSLEPTPVEGLTDVMGVSAGDEHTCAVDRDGSVWCWGENAHGQLGDGTGVGHATPVPVEGFGSVRALRLGGATSCAIRADDSVWCWGKNDAGQLGTGDTESRDRPTAVAIPEEPEPPPEDAGVDADAGPDGDAGDSSDTGDGA
jgi:alpha-tubulin suppressor-like RCC1 family protein